MFVPSSSIVTSTGVVSPTLARRANAFGRVVDVVSDLRSQSAQAIFTLRPYIPSTVRPYFGDVSLSYTLSDIRAQQRGFDGATAGDPATKEWARGDLDARHLLVAQWVFRPLGDGRLIAFMYGRAQSGLPYTPMVASDVNGDGLANDRAFVFSPTATTDTSAARGIRSLLAGSSSNVRDCLSSQLGRIADRNGCQGPWTATMNVGVRMNGQQLLHTPRMDVMLNLTNPLGGLDQLLHGANDLHGWGAAAIPDRTLYTVRGFDPTTSRFLYTVNPRFGSTQPSTNTVRAPFRLTLDVQLDIARSMPEQQLDRWLRPGRAGRPGQKLPAQEFMRRYQRTVPDPYGELLQQDGLAAPFDCPDDSDSECAHRLPRQSGRDVDRVERVPRRVARRLRFRQLRRNAPTTRSTRSGKSHASTCSNGSARSSPPPRRRCSADGLVSFSALAIVSTSDFRRGEVDSTKSTSLGVCRGLRTRDLLGGDGTQPGTAVTRGHQWRVDRHTRSRQQQSASRPGLSADRLDIRGQGVFGRRPAGRDAGRFAARRQRSLQS